MKKILILTITCLISINSYSQNKFGHVNMQELLIALPEYKIGEEELKKFQNSLQSQLQSMQMEFQKAYQNFVENAETYDDLVKKDKETEILSLQQRIESFERDASEALQKKEIELLTPLNDKIEKAIKEVAIEGNYTYIFEKTLAGILYSKESENIIEKVKKKLNL